MPAQRASAAKSQGPHTMLWTSENNLGKTGDKKEGRRRQASDLVAYLLPTMSDRKPPRGRAQKFIIPKMEAKLAALLVEKPNCDPR